MVRKASTKIIVVLLSTFLIGAPVLARSVNITVHSGATHTWGGFGSSVLDGRWGFSYNSFSETGKKKLNRMLVDSINMRLFMTGWLEPSNLTLENPGRLLTGGKDHVNDLRALCDDIIILQGVYPPGGVSGFSYQNPQQWASLLASVIKSAQNNDNIRVDATELANEPQAHNPPLLPLADYPASIKHMRSELNSRGLGHVKIVAPSHCNVESSEIPRLKPVFDDPEALNALDVYGFHSYYMAMRKDVRDALYNKGIKEFWVTEGGSNAIKLEFPLDQDTALYEAGHVGNWLADINLGTSYYRAHEVIGVWGHIKNKQPMTRANYWWLTSDANGDVKCFKKYYYAKQFSRGIDSKAGVRLCSSDLPGGDRFTWMEAPYGARPHMFACAAQNEDQTWGISLINVTGSPPMKWRSSTCNSFPGAENLAVSVQVDELSGAGTIEFEVFRTGATTLDEAQGTVIMNNGKVTVSLSPADMVTLRSKKPTTVAKPVGKKAVSQKPAFEFIRSSGNAAIRITLADQNHRDGVPVKAALFDFRGRMVSSVPRTIVRNGSTIFLLNNINSRGTKLAEGIHFLRVTLGNTAYCRQVSIPVN